MRDRVVLTRTVAAEAMGANRWYAERSTAAGRWYDGFERSLAKLAEGPNRRPVSEEDSAALGREVRQMPHGRRRGVYRILFAVEGDEITVLRVRHAARGPIEWPEVGEPE